MSKDLSTRYKVLQARAKSLLMDLELLADEYELSLPEHSLDHTDEEASRSIELTDQLAWLEDIVNFSWDNPV